MRLFPLAVASILLLSSCSSPPPPAAPPPKPCEALAPVITVVASGQVNAGPDGKGLPVQVRLYQLKSEARLLNAFFEEVWKEDQKTFAEDMLDKREITVFPGKSQKLELEQLPDTRVLSAVALFREPRGRDWFLNYDLEQAKKEPPCPTAGPRISIWLDRMKIQDGEGRVEAEATPATEAGPTVTPEAAPASGGN